MLTTRMQTILPEFTMAPAMGRLMNAFLAPGETAGEGVAAVFPAINVWEDDSAFHLEAELPGYSMSNIDISMTGQELTISGSREEKLPENATVIRCERPCGNTRFSRSFRIASPVDADKVSATFEAGVLSVKLPKAEHARPRKIEVRAG